MKEIILINITGPDRPGLTAAMTGILAKSSVNILDIGQAVIHDTLSFGILIELPDGSQKSNVLKDILFRASELDQQVRFTPIHSDDYQLWVSGQGKSRHIVTILGRRITAEHIERVSTITARNGLNIDHIDRLSGRIPESQPLEQRKACIEFSVRGDPENLDALRAEFLTIAQELNVDIAFQKDSIFRRTRRLVVFDMDSTLIEAEVIDELAKAAGVGDQVVEITERAMRGELDFQDSFRERVALLKGLPESTLADIAERLSLTEGAEELIKQLRRLGYKTAILSGGFQYFAERLQKRLGIDYVFANALPVKNGVVTGEVELPIVDGQRKADLLKELANKECISLEQTIAVGDGANDLPMLSIAGLGVAFRAKPLVKQSAKQAISTLGLDGILYLLGIRDRDSFT